MFTSTRANNYIFNENENKNENENENENENVNNPTLNILRIKHNRNRPRMSHELWDGAIAFDICWSDNSESREPLQCLIFPDIKYINKYVIDIIKDYKEIAEQYPNNNRKCLMCHEKVNNGHILCLNDYYKYSFIL